MAGYRNNKLSNKSLCAVVKYVNSAKAQVQIMFYKIYIMSATFQPRAKWVGNFLTLKKKGSAIFQTSTLAN